MRVRYIGVVCAALVGAAPALAQQVDVRRATAATGPMEVHVLAGEVTLTGWNRNEIRVTGDIGRGAERLEVTPEGDRLVVRVVYPRGARATRGSDLEIHYPRRRAVRVTTASADVEVQSPAGNLVINTASGNVAVHGSPAEMEVNTRSGDVQLDGSTGRLSVNSVSGDVQVGGAVPGEVQANTVSGDIQLDGPVGTLRAHSVSGSVRAGSVTGAAEAQSVSGDIEIAARTLTGRYSTVSGGVTLSGRPAPGRTLEVRSHSGFLELILPRGTDADVEVSTFSGNVDAEVEGARLVRSSRRERHLRLGRGGARVELSTFSGSVRIEQR